MVGQTHRVAQHRSALRGMEAMTLLTDHAFPRHSHDGLGIGLMAAGAQRSWSGVGWVESRAGDVITVNLYHLVWGRLVEWYTVSLPLRRAAKRQEIE